MVAFPTLITTRLILRELTLNDVSALFAIHSDAETLRLAVSDPTLDIGRAEKLLAVFAELWHSQLGLRWAIERRSDSALLGTCGFFKWNHTWHSCSIDYELAASAGSDDRHEALTAALNYAFDIMQINRIEAQVYAANKASFNMLGKLGFEPEGIQRQAGFWQGAYQDLHHLALLSSAHDKQ